MNKTVANTDPEAAVRYLEAQPVRYKATRRPYIPLGCDQQGRVTPTMLLDDARLAPAEELQAPGYCAANRSERTHRVIVGGVVVLLMVLAVVGFIARVLL